MFSQLNIQLPEPQQQLKKGQPTETCKGFSSSYSKKKIGDYAYYLNDLIGSGYSSQVYKCFHREQPNTAYAIKVINLSKLAKANLNLLRDEIKILQTLNHPNIIKFHNFYFTENNCYLITDFCEGGTLQQHIDHKKTLNYEEVFDQLVEGCKYLEQKLIVHRDIKPANVFLKGNQWKIGDFGFARFIEREDVVVKQMYKVGSPLYMPPEALSSSIYSLKTDSFALGISVFYMVTKRFPWVGSNDKELLENYKNNAFPSCMLQNISLKMQKHIQDLCQLDIKNRILIKDIESVVIKNPEQRINHQTIRKKVAEPCIPERSGGIPQTYQQEDLSTMDLQKLKAKLDLDIIQRIKLAKFVYYLIANIQQFDSLGPLREKLEKLLKLLTVFFEWVDNPSFIKYLNEFNCSHAQEYQQISQICQLRDNISEAIETLSWEKQNTKLVISRLKLIQLRHIMRLSFDKNTQKLQKYVNKCLLHPDFSKIYFQQFQVQEIERLA